MATLGVYRVTSMPWEAGFTHPEAARERAVTATRSAVRAIAPCARAAMGPFSDGRDWLGGYLGSPVWVTCVLHMWKYGSEVKNAEM